MFARMILLIADDLHDQAGLRKLSRKSVKALFRAAQSSMIRYSPIVPMKVRSSSRSHNDPIHHPLRITPPIMYERRKSGRTPCCLEHHSRLRFPTKASLVRTVRTVVSASMNTPTDLSRVTNPRFTADWFVHTIKTNPFCRNVTSGSRPGTIDNSSLLNKYPGPS